MAKRAVEHSIRGSEAVEKLKKKLLTR